MRFFLWGLPFMRKKLQNVLGEIHFQIMELLYCSRKKKVFTPHLRSIDYIPLHMILTKQYCIKDPQLSSHTCKGGFHDINPCLWPYCRVKVKIKYN